MSIIENLERMLATGRDDAMLRFGLGSAYFNEKQFESAVQQLEACLRHDENYSAGYKVLGKAYFLKGDLDNAQRVFEAGKPIAVDQGDKQTQKEIAIFLKKIDQKLQRQDQREGHRQE